MRGAPFGQKNFSRGLNAIDSPYTLQEGEARDCLNVVSSPRGAIRKRNGSNIFASGSVAFMPSPVAKDTFVRANEDPLNNGGNWGVFGAATSLKLDTNAAAIKAGKVEGYARWAAEEKTNPAVSIQITKFGELTILNLYSCSNEAGTKNYEARFRRIGGTWEARLYKDSATLLASIVISEPKLNEAFGMSVRSKIVTGWRKPSGGEWTKILEVEDASYKEGFAGFGLTDPTEKVGVKEFCLSPMEASVIEPEFTSLLPCKIGANNFLIAASGTKLFSVTEGGELNEIGSGFTEGVRWSIVQSTTGGKNKIAAEGPVYLVNGTDVPQTWKGTTKTTATESWKVEKGATNFFEEVKTIKEVAPNGKYMVLAGNRIWMAGMSGDTSAVRFCDFSSLEEGGKQTDPTQWPKENVVRFDKADNEPITGLGVVGPYVLVFKAHKTWVIYDLNEGANRKLSDHIGCVANRSIVETSSGAYFLTPDQGVFVTNGSTLKEVSRNVLPLLKGEDPIETTIRAAKVGSLEKAASEFLNSHYYVSYEALDGTVKTLDYDTVLGSWWLHDIGCNQWVHWEIGGTVLLYGVRKKTKEGILRVFVPKVYQDIGSNYTGARGYTAYWISSWEPFFQYVLRHRIDAPNQKKRIRQWFLDGSGSVEMFDFSNFLTELNKVKAVVNAGDMSVPEETTTLTLSEREVSAARAYSIGAHRIWSFGVGNKSKEPFEIDGMQMLVQFRKS